MWPPQPDPLGLGNPVACCWPVNWLGGTAEREGETRRESQPEGMVRSVRLHSTDGLVYGTSFLSHESDGWELGLLPVAMINALTKATEGGKGVFHVTIPSLSGRS